VKIPLSLTVTILSDLEKAILNRSSALDSRLYEETRTQSAMRLVSPTPLLISVQPNRQRPFAGISRNPTSLQKTVRRIRRQTSPQGCLADDRASVYSALPKSPKSSCGNQPTARAGTGILGTA
jgi:hypothetical protein